MTPPDCSMAELQAVLLARDLRDGEKAIVGTNSDVQYGNSLPGGGMGTPTFFINGRKLAGAYPFENFDKLIKEALAKK